MFETNPKLGNTKSYKTKVIYYRKSGKVKIKKVKSKTIYRNNSKSNGQVGNSRKMRQIW